MFPFKKCTISNHSQIVTISFNYKLEQLMIIDCNMLLVAIIMLGDYESYYFR